MTQTSSTRRALFAAIPAIAVAAPSIASAAGLNGPLALAKLEAASPVRQAWDTAVSQWRAACEAKRFADASKAHGEDAAWERTFDAWCDAWQALVDAPAPDAGAMVYKLRAILNAGPYNDELGDEPDHPAFYQRLLNETAQDSAFPLVRLLQDACRIADVTHPAASLERERAA